MKSIFERWLEAGLFNARWLMAPIYAGLSLALLGLVVVFGREVIHQLPHIWTMDTEHAILAVLSLIDLSLTGNLLVIVIFSGYENFVSKFDMADTDDRPSWMGKVDFAALKMKLLGSIVAISAIALLRQFMQMGQEGAMAPQQLFWLVTIHLTFVVSGVLLALMDWLSSRSAGHH